MWQNLIKLSEFHLINRNSWSTKLDDRKSNEKLISYSFWKDQILKRYSWKWSVTLKILPVEVKVT